MYLGGEEMDKQYRQYSIKELRARKDITQGELAKLTGLTARTIYVYEKDAANLRNASYSNIKKIADALDVKVEEIFLG